MRVLQLIDSLHPGGAERMAVSLANELSGKFETSYLCATREEGLLKTSISEKVNYTFLNKKRRLDILALRTLIGLVKKNKINVIHAHSSSFFYGWMVKFFSPSVRLIWHDHYGNSELLGQRNSKMLRFCSSKFSAIIAVNTLLAEWSTGTLKCKKVLFVKNFVSKNPTKSDTITLLGASGKRIICVANFRPQKDHFNLLSAFQLIKKEIPKASLHLVGNHKSAHGEEIKAYLEKQKFTDIYIYGELNMTSSIFDQCSLGVLSSLSEGLPVALLEYGLNNLPVVVTDVGQCKEVIGDTGKLVVPKNPIALAEACISYLKDQTMANSDATQFNSRVLTKYAFNSIFDQLMTLYTE